ncbi:universal stress protein [Nitrosopumilus sp. b3]|uniref:universal stress protein n=1 Tax=Nitrosopumilus sp. b3 TaxID=2109909 RepID=UPI0015F5080A|nr:universal stress protein [Nitrosopumilus sp. b3]KAF6247487.1 universal stress protein [Nitrosopumilus sp. b3]
MITKKIKKIVIPFDGSICSKHAFDMALNLAQKYNSKLILLTCIEKINGSWYGKEFSHLYQKDVKKYREKILKETSKLELISKKKKITTATKIFVTDSIVDQILSFTKSNKADMIVMGSHGRSGIDKLILGSIANGVVQRSKIPVLVVR